MATLATDLWTSELERAVDHLRQVAIGLAIDDPTRAQLEAASNRLASYALAARDLALAGVSAERLRAIIERGWREGAVAFAAAPPFERMR
jgi:hypothetical protein